MRVRFLYGIRNSRPGNHEIFRWSMVGLKENREWLLTVFFHVWRVILFTMIHFVMIHGKYYRYFIYLKVGNHDNFHVGGYWLVSIRKSRIFFTIIIIWGWILDQTVFTVPFCNVTKSQGNESIEFYSLVLQMQASLLPARFTIFPGISQGRCPKTHISHLCILFTCSSTRTHLV